MQGLSLSQHSDSVTKDGTKSSEARASRCTKKNNEVELQGATEEMGNNMCCHGNERQAKFNNKTTKAIADYVGRECNEDMRKSVSDSVKFVLMEPPEPLGEVPTHKTKKHKKDLA